MTEDKKLNICTLPNGLRFIHSRSNETASFEFTMHIDTGSRDETPETNGVSHFLEHMMFRGSQNYPNSVLLASAMESFGGEANAMTSVENTVYWLKGSTKKLDHAAEIFAEFFLRPNFADFETERDIILQELASDYNEAGDNIDCETLSMGGMFPNHALGLPIIGTEATVANLTVEHLKAKHSAHYRPENCILSLVSPCTFEQAVRRAEAAFAHTWTHASKNEFKRNTIPENYFDHKKRTLILQNNSDNQYSLKIMLPGAGGLNKKVVEDIIVERLLDDGISSRLPATVREKYGLVYDISADAQSFADVGTFSVDATISQDSMQKLLDVLVEELCSVCLKPPSHDELDRMKFRYLFDLDVLHESHSRLISREVSQLFLDTPLPLNDEREIVKSITPEQVLSAARRILTHHRQTVVLVGPRARKFRSPIEKFLDQLNRYGG